MARSDERVLEEHATADETTETADGQRLSGLRNRVSSPFSLRAFLLALGLAVAGSALAGFVPFVPTAVATLVGVFAGGFVLGLVRSTRSYLEVAASGVAVAVVAVLSQYLVVSFLGDVGVPVALIGAGSGLLAGVLGHYFGRDLRAGLTKDL